MKRHYIFFLIASFAFVSCKKWLDVKSNMADVTPVTLSDYQAITDLDALINDLTPDYLALISSDNYYVTYTTWQARSATERNGYIWASNVYEGAAQQDWSRPYQVIEEMNIVLEGLPKVIVTPANNTQWNTTKGNALFVRAHKFYGLAQIFCKPYAATTAATDPGIPLRTGTDVNETSIRATVQETYDKIIADLKEAESLLPIVSSYQTQPCKSAAQALLAKTYLAMGDYAHAVEYADKALTANSTLIDFNTLNAASTQPMSVYPGNSEVIYYTTSFTPSIISNTNPVIDSVLYQSYTTNDLRKTVFYRINANLPVFKGWYTGKTNAYFSGIATNELYLIRAEANARLGNTATALTALNTLLLKRWKTGSFVPYTATSATDALTKIFAERRKELPFTGSLRWEDLRRMNLDVQFAKTLTRSLNGQTYTLAPNDIKYTLAIPDIEIKLSGIQQNPR